MDVKNIRQYAELMREMELTALELHLEDGTIRMERNLPVSAPAPGAVQTVSVPAEAPAVREPAADEVVSPMVGMFYTAPAENAAPFVQVGDYVHRGDVLCIIEAMKMLNEIESEFEGEVTQILVADGELVEFGQPLMVIE